MSITLGATSTSKPVLLANLLEAHPGVEGLHPHAARLGIEPEQPQRGDHAGHAPEHQAGLAATAVAVEPARAGHEVDPLDEAPAFVGRDDNDLATQGGDVVGAAGTG